MSSNMSSNTSSPTSSRIRFTSARQVFEAYASARDDITAAPADAPPLDFLRALARSATPEDALSFSAYLLPRREAVWWACQCVQGLSPGVSAGEPAFAAAAAWVRDPEEDRRRAALAAGQTADPNRAGTWLALAAGWSGGSLTPDGMEPVAPPAHLTAKAVRAAVLLAVATVAARERDGALAACVDACVRFAEGGDAKLKPPPRP